MPDSLATNVRSLTSASLVGRARRGSFLLLLSAAVGGTLAQSAFPASALAQTNAGSPAAAGCTVKEGGYTCNLNALRQHLAAAHTVALETQANDRFTAAQLRHLASDLGKVLATPDQIADLTFQLIPVDPPGIQFGPAGQALATLRVYGAGVHASRGPLLWAETWTGQHDRPWPAVAHALIEQFQERLANH